MTSPLRLAVTAAVSCVLGSAAAGEPQPYPIDAVQKTILDRAPRTRVEKVDRQRLTVRRIDVVDEKGVIRMTLAAPTPPPIVDGVQYKRAFPVSGLVVYDRDGSERGGYGVADVEGTATVLAQDHVNGDAIGWRVMPDGSVSFGINQRSPVLREPALGGHVRPDLGAPTRIGLTVAADGTPAIALADGENRPRLRLTVTKEGYGAIEFLDAQGKVVETFAPEARRGTH